MKRRDEVLVGLLLVVSIVVGLAGTIWLARGGLASGYPLYARFPWGAGLKNGQPVLLAGVNVGFVRKVELIPNGTLLVTFSVNKEYEVPVGTTATVEPNGIFGDQLIALTPHAVVSSYHVKGDTIPTGEGSPSVADLLSKADSIAGDVRGMTAELNSEYVAEGGFRELRETTRDLAKLVSQLGTIAAEQSRELSQTQAQLRATLAAVDPAVVDSTLRNFRTSSENLAELSASLEETRAQVGRVLAKVDSGDGAAARLLNDPALYARVDTLLMRLDSLAIDVKANPRRYINLRIF